MLCLGGEARAQPGVGDPPPPIQDDGSLVGQWTGPWNLKDLINPDVPIGAPFNHTARNWAEIAHMVVLPPRDATAKTLVLLVCRRLDGAAPGSHGGDVSSVAFLLDPNDPMALETIVVNSLPGPTGMGKWDPFCGAHVLTAAGDVFWVGGTDVRAESLDATGDPWGHSRAYLMVWNGSGWQWQLAAGQMGDPRWYPSITTLADGRKAIWGHAAKPVSIPPADQTREYVSINGTTVTWESPGLALINDRLADCGPNPPPLSLGDYPHMHVVNGDRVLWTGTELGMVPPTDALFDLAACSATAERFADDLNVGEPYPESEGLNSVHLINLARDPFEEAVYTLGGDFHDSASESITNRVLKMSNPSDTTEWSDAPPDLNASVINANTVIMLDGALIRFGGFGYDEVTDTYPARLKPERYHPPEIFTTPSTGWDEMQAAKHERRYHSTAVLLPDGRVITGGGDDVQVGAVVEPSWHSVEIFNPTFMFSLPRPRITAFPSTIGYGAGFQMSAVLRTTSTAGEFRVALLGPGSATHGVDFSQRYVVLDVHLELTEPNPDTNAATDITVLPPPRWAAPPGWYLLTVVNSEGMPAVAKWVQVGP